MSNYLYKARDAEGKAVTGVMESASAEKLAEKLRELGYMPTQIKEAAPGVDLERFSQRFKKIKPEESNTRSDKSFNSEKISKQVK